MVDDVRMESSRLEQLTKAVVLTVRGIYTVHARGVRYPVRESRVTSYRTRLAEVRWGAGAQPIVCTADPLLGPTVTDNHSFLHALFTCTCTSPIQRAKHHELVYVGFKRMTALA